MSFSMDSHLEARLREIARQQGRDLDSVVAEALRSYAETAARSNGADQPPATSSEPRYPLRGTVLQYDEPFKPALPDEDWESLR